MSTIRLQQNNEQIAAIAAAVLIVLVFVANVYILVTSLSAVYLDKSITESAAPIDTKTVTEAIELLGK